MSAGSVFGAGLGDRADAANPDERSIPQPVDRPSSDSRHSSVASKAADLPWREIAPDELLRRLAEPVAPMMIDVRTPRETHAYRIPGVLLIPLDQLPARYAEIDPNREALLICEHGIRSTAACRFLAERGYSRLANMTGGMSCWSGPTASGR